MRRLALLSALLVVLGGAAASEAPLYGVMTQPWALQLSANQPKQVSKEYVVSVETPVDANLPLGKAYYGVFVADSNHAAMIVDLTPMVTGEADGYVVVDPHATLVKFPPVKFKHLKPPKGSLLALSLETKPMPIGMSLQIVKPENLTVKVGQFQIKLNKDLLEGLARVIATYEYAHPHGKVTVGCLQALVFKYLLMASLTKTMPTTSQVQGAQGQHNQNVKQQKGATNTAATNAAATTNATTTATANANNNVSNNANNNANNAANNASNANSSSSNVNNANNNAAKTGQKTQKTEQTQKQSQRQKKIEEKVNEETGYALQAFLKVNEQRGLTDVKAEFDVHNLENLIGEAAAVLENVASNPETQKVASKVETGVKKAVQVPVAALVGLLGIAVLAVRRR